VSDGAPDGSRTRPARIHRGGDAVDKAVKREKDDKKFGTPALVDAATLDAAREQGLALTLDGVEPVDAAIEDGRVRHVYGWPTRVSSA
jgi:hypothetical protein